jgi:NADH:ubiquinone oxidoreductase subunit E
MPETTVAVFSVEDAMDELERIYSAYHAMPGNTIPILQDMQETFGYVPEEAVNWIADRLGAPRSSFFGVATFYSQFNLAPRGRRIITVCCGTACHVKGAEKLLARAQSELGLPDGQETTDDMEFTLNKVACLGTCSMAPAVLVDKKMHGGMKPDVLAREIKNMKKEA